MPDQGMRHTMAPATTARTYGAEHDGELANFITRMSHRIGAHCPFAGEGIADDMAQNAWAWVADYRGRGEREGMHLGAEFQRARWAMWDVLEVRRRWLRNAGLATYFRHAADCAGDDHVDGVDVLTAIDLEAALASITGVKGWRYRRALLEGMTAAEIARADGVSPSLVSRQIIEATHAACDMLGNPRVEHDDVMGYFEGPACPRGHTLRERDKRGKLGCVTCRRERATRYNRKQQEERASA